jgi:eukaryotic-like serine/threonine-protein kinase
MYIFQVEVIMLSGEQKIGRYRLLQRIGSGGMGEIYLAEDTQMNRQVAMKIVRGEIGPYPDPVTMQDAARLFQREMRAITMLDHGSILPLFDFGEEKVNTTVITYMVMPFRKEGSLADWLQRREQTQKLTPQEVAYFIRQAADALQHAHDRGLVHQDVKPSNFLVRDRSGDMLPDLLLADFGIAKMTSATTTASQSIRGTPAFMAPEQWEGTPQPATDQYALATMAYLLLTGSTPFSGRMEQVMRQHFMTSPAAPSSRNPELSPDIDTVLLHALKKQPEERFSSISAFSQAFQQASGFIQQGTPIPRASTGAIPAVQSQPSQENVQRTPDALRSTIYPSTPSTPDHSSTPPPHPPAEPTVIADPLKATAEAALQSPPLPSEPTLAVDSMQIAPQATLQPPPPPLVSQSNSTQKSRNKRPLLLVLVILLIIASVAGLGTYQNHVQQVNADATASADNATADAATAIVYANATATAVANTAATAQAVADNPYPSYLPGNGTLAFVDPLQASNQWSEDSSNTDGGMCQFSNGAYVVSETQTNYYKYCGTTQTFDNFAFEVQLTITQGDCGGIDFRIDSPKLYYFHICQNGAYKIVRYVSNSGSDAAVLLESTSTAINTGLNQQNTIAVVANDSTLTFYVNKQQIDQEQDSNYSSGEIGLLADPQYNNATSVAYTNARLWTL